MVVVELELEIKMRNDLIKDILSVRVASCALGEGLSVRAMPEVSRFTCHFEAFFCLKLG